MSQIEPLGSIIIPTYNHGKYIERSIESALSQTLENLEIIVVDDGSTDDTRERIKQFEGRVFYHRKENGGLGNSRNKGIEISRGKYLQFLDADDSITADKLEKQIALMEADDELDVVYSDCRLIGPNGENFGNASQPLAKNDSLIEKLFETSLMPVHASTVRRSAIIDVGMFDESRIAQEDWDLWLRLAIKGRKFQYLPGVLAFYHQEGSNITTNPELMYRRTKHLLDKHVNNPELIKLGKKRLNSFVAHQSIHLATRAYNNRWWKQARGQFLKTALANAKLMNLNYWACIPKTVVFQVIDVLSGKRVAEPDNF